jgi:hypothetical protein
MEKKTKASQLRVGDRIWFNDRGTMKVFSVETPSHWMQNEHFNEDWGFLCDNETVIGGQILRPNPSDSDTWLIGDYSIKTASIYAGGESFLNCTAHYSMLHKDREDIQKHVARGYAVPVTKRAPIVIKLPRTAQDVKAGDEIWVKKNDNAGKYIGIVDEADPKTCRFFYIRKPDNLRTHLEFADFNKTWAFVNSTKPELESKKTKLSAQDAKIGDEVWLLGMKGVLKNRIEFVYVDHTGKKVNYVQIGDTDYYVDSFGTDWGFWEEVYKSATTKTILPPTTTVIHTNGLPHKEPIEQPSNPYNNVLALINAKGKDWVRQNAPTAWRAFCAKGVEEARQAHEDLKSKPFVPFIPKL